MQEKPHGEPKVSRPVFPFSGSELEDLKTSTSKYASKVLFLLTSTITFNHVSVAKCQVTGAVSKLYIGAFQSINFLTFPLKTTQQWSCWLPFYLSPVLPITISIITFAFIYWIVLFCHIKRASWFFFFQSFPATIFLIWWELIQFFVDICAELQTKN